MLSDSSKSLRGAKPLTLKLLNRLRPTFIPLPCLYLPLCHRAHPPTPPPHPPALVFVFPSLCPSPSRVTSCWSWYHGDTGGATCPCQALLRLQQLLACGHFKGSSQGRATGGVRNRPCQAGPECGPAAVISLSWKIRLRIFSQTQIMGPVRNHPGSNSKLRLHFGASECAKACSYMNANLKSSFQQLI